MSNSVVINVADDGITMLGHLQTKLWLIGIILCMHWANERHHIVTYAWAHTQNDSWTKFIDYDSKGYIDGLVQDCSTILSRGRWVRPVLQLAVGAVIMESSVGGIYGTITCLN